jgi:hypothetical protein
MKTSQEEDSTPFLHPNTNTNTAEEDLLRPRDKSLFNYTWGVFTIVLIVTNVISLQLGGWLWRASLDRVCAIHTSQHESKAYKSSIAYVLEITNLY